MVRPVLALSPTRIARSEREIQKDIPSICGELLVGLWVLRTTHRGLQRRIHSRNVIEGAMPIEDKMMIDERRKYLHTLFVQLFPSVGQKSSSLVPPM